MHVTRVARRSPKTPTKYTKWTVFPSRRAPLPGVRGYPGRPAAQVDRREYPADSRASWVDAGGSRRAGRGGAENDPALGNRGSKPDDRPRGYGRGCTRRECVDSTAVGDAEAAPCRAPTATATGTLVGRAQRTRINAACEQAPVRSRDRAGRFAPSFVGRARARADPATADHV